MKLINKIWGIAPLIGAVALVGILIACGGGDAAEPEVSPKLAEPKVSPPPAEPKVSPTPADPEPSGISIGPSLRFEGVQFVYDGYAELETDDALVFVIDGTEIAVGDLEVVGTTNEGNTPGIQEGLQVYRQRSGGAENVYTFTPGEDVVNPEDGQILSSRDAWTRWTPGEVAKPLLPILETCTGILDLEEVRAGAGRSDITIAIPSVGSGPQDANVAGITSNCVIEYVTPEIVVGGPTELRVSGPSMTLTAISFDLPESAAAHQVLVLEGIQSMREVVSPRPEVIEGLVGPDSYLLTADAEGIGSIVGLLVGRHVVQLHTTLPVEGVPLVTPELLQSFARAVGERLALIR